MSSPKPPNPVRQSLDTKAMESSYGHRIMAIHVNPLNKCDHCKHAAVWETDYKFFGEHAANGSNPEQVCDTHAKEFAARWPSAVFPVTPR